MEIFMNLFHIFYVQPMFFAVVETIIMCVVWMVIMLILHRKAQRTISIVCCILSVGVILLFTVHGRSSGEGLQLAPFFYRREFFRTNGIAQNAVNECIPVHTFRLEYAVRTIGKYSPQGSHYGHCRIHDFCICGSVPVLFFTGTMRNG